MIRLHPSIAALLGLVEIDDAIIDDVIARIRLRCGNVNLHLHKRLPDQAALENAACEAIVAVFRDHNPNANIRTSKKWPIVNCTLKGERATFEIWLGQEYNSDDEGIEPFDLVVDRGRNGVGVVERAQVALSRKPKHEPELQLRKQAEVETTKTETKSAARSLLDRTKR